MEKLTGKKQFLSKKRQYLPHFLSDKSFKDTVLNRALPSLHRGSLEITLTVPLNP